MSNKIVLQNIVAPIMGQYGSSATINEYSFSDTTPIFASSDGNRAPASNTSHAMLASEDLHSDTVFLDRDLVASGHGHAIGTKRLRNRSLGHINMDDEFDDSM